MPRFIVEPEVAGELGSDSVLDRSVHPPVVKALHYHFQGWLGDVLLETFPAFIIQDDIAENLIASGFTGFELKDLKVSYSADFQLSESMPSFSWLFIMGDNEIDDFYTFEDGRLIVSERALNFLNKHGISNAVVQELS